MIVEKASPAHTRRKKREREERRRIKAETKVVTQISERVTLVQFCMERPNKSMIVKKVDPKTLPKYQRGFADTCGGAGGGARFCSTGRDKR